jgi:dTDP-4-dehydrorhamnose reductase
MARLGAGHALGTYYRRAFPGGVSFDGTRQNVGDLLAQLPAGFSHAFVLHGTVGTEACARDPVGTAETNIESMWRVLRSLLDAGIAPVYISTDYVFDGTRGAWRESDQPTPCTQYGMQKLEVERRLSADRRPSLIVRLSRVVATELDTHSVLGPWLEEIRAGKTMRCATDQVFSPTGVDDVAGALIKLAGTGATGLYHMGGPVPFSRIGLLHLLAERIQAFAPGVRANIVPCSLHDLPFTEKLPLNTSLAIDKLQNTINWDFVSMQTICAELAERHFGVHRTTC